MSVRYFVVLEGGASLPERDFFIYHAWGDVPVSYFQDGEVLNECSFLDLKVNKWELNSAWSDRQENEPWIRIEMYREQLLEEYLQDNEGLNFLIGACGALITLGMDEGGGAIDDMLFLRLVSVFVERFNVYRWSGSIEKASKETIGYLPSGQLVRELLCN